VQDEPGRVNRMRLTERRRKPFCR